MNIAVSLLEAVGSTGRGSRIINLIGGPATIGPGKIVDEKFSERIRSHLDIMKKNDPAKHFQAATKYYTDLALRA